MNNLSPSITTESGSSLSFLRKIYILKIRNLLTGMLIVGGILSVSGQQEQLSSDTMNTLKNSTTNFTTNNKDIQASILAKWREVRHEIPSVATVQNADNNKDLKNVGNDLNLDRKTTINPTIEPIMIDLSDQYVKLWVHYDKNGDIRVADFKPYHPDYNQEDNQRWGEFIAGQFVKGCNGE